MTIAGPIDVVDAMRRDRGLLCIGELLALADQGIIVLDPWSILISRNVDLGHDTVIEPNVLLLCAPGSTLRVGTGNTFHPGARIEAAGGSINIGAGNSFGPGGFIATATAGTSILIGDSGRYTLNCAISGNTTLGSGSQILGPIAVDGCRLGAGGSHRETDPDQRGAVLKGTGRARGLSLGQGHVIQGFGLFDMADARLQSYFHPPKADSK